MPAGSERPAGAVPPLPRTYRPFGPRIAVLVFGTVLVGAFAFLWLSFDEPTRASVSWLQRSTVIGFILLALACMYAMARSRVEATDRGLVVVNGYRRRDLEWAEVVSVRMPPGAPWPTIDVSDGTTVSVMGIHGSDGARAQAAVRELRALLAAR
ncbi:MAG TPA: PH domain-containing protein [Nocardioides sp.]|nr:PH domain-containing protein [Nocardioides sp.]